VIRVLLRDAMRRHADRTGHKVTYESLSEATGIAVATLQSIGSRQGYNATLSTIERICRALECSPGDLLFLGDADGNSEI
jgi:DNA-binding Xre family transcriptional regulator